MIRVEYGVVAQGAKESFSPQLLHCAALSKADDILKDDANFKNFANPCEKYSALLGGGSIPIPEDTENEDIGVWSLYATNNSGIFEGAFPEITLVSDDFFDVDGLSLVFDIENNVYPTEFVVFWYNNEEAILSKQYVSNSPSFSLLEDVGNCNKIRIAFLRMNTPFSRLKLHGIKFGSILIIDESTIKNIKVHQIKLLVFFLFSL